MNSKTRYVVRRADGKYLVIASTMDRRRVAMRIDDLEFATSWPFMTGATLVMGLDLDPCLLAERGGLEVIPVAPRPATDVVWLSVELRALPPDNPRAVRDDGKRAGADQSFAKSNPTAHEN